MGDVYVFFERSDNLYWFGLAMSVKGVVTSSFGYWCFIQTYLLLINL